MVAKWQVASPTLPPQLLFEHDVFEQAHVCLTISRAPEAQLCRGERRLLNLLTTPHARRRRREPDWTSSAFSICVAVQTTST